MKDHRPAGNGKVFRFPWWGSVLLAIVCYCTLKYLIPQLQPAHPILAKLAGDAPFFAPIVAIPLLLLAAKQLYDTDDKEDDETDGGENGDGREE